MTDERLELSRYLAANPGMTPRDFKGKGFTAFNPFDKYYEGPNEEPWHELKREDVRRIATSDKARFLPRNIRQAAARDPGLEWDAQSLAYRLRAAGPRAPFPASEANDREGVRKVRGASPSRPAAATRKNANTQIAGESHD